MPTTTEFSGGFVNNTTFVLPIPIPSIEGELSAIRSISVLRSNGLLLTDGDQMLVGLSHQANLLATDLTDDPDDLLFDENNVWWVHALSDTDHVLDRLDMPEEVAGPQSMIIHNATGATTAVRVDVGWSQVRGIAIPRWTLIKTLTSFER